MTLAVQFAMAAEAEAFTSRRAFTRLPTKSPYDFQYFQDGDLIVAVAGAHPRFKVDSIGSVAAALLTHELVERFSLSRLINAGTGGGFAARGGAIGDVYLGADVTVFHDRRIQLAGFDKMGRGHFPVESDAGLAARHGLKLGIVSSGDSLDCTAEDMRHLLELGASVKDMEAASIAWVCERRGVPLVLVKAITDLVDLPEATASQFEKNYPGAVKNLAEAVEHVVAHYRDAK